MLSINKITAQNIIENFYSPQNRLAFGNSLFHEEDYLRAIDEYLAYIQFHPNDTIKFKIAYAYQKMGDYNQAVDNFKGLFFNSSFYHEARAEYYKTNFLSMKYYQFRELVGDGFFITPQNQNYVASLNNVTYLLDNIYLPDSNDFIAPFDQKYKDDMARFYYAKMNPKNKNITTGIILSSIIPGAGKVYADQFTDGLTAFLITGVLGFLAYDNFRADHDFRAWLFTGLAAYFYAGNIYGTAVAVQQYNAGIKFNLENDVKIYLEKNNYLSPGYDFLK